jgi:hypothetical protein
MKSNRFALLGGRTLERDVREGATRNRSPQEGRVRLADIRAHPCSVASRLSSAPPSPVWGMRVIGLVRTIVTMYATGAFSFKSLARSLNTRGRAAAPPSPRRPRSEASG